MDKWIITLLGEEMKTDGNTNFDSFFERHKARLHVLQIEILNEGGSCNEKQLHVNVELHEGEERTHLD